MGEVRSHPEPGGRRSRAFPGGIADSASRTAFVELARDAVVAVDLKTGEVRWRRADGGRPLLATDAGLLVVRRRQERLELALLEPSTGEDERVLGALPAPDWAAQEWDNSDGFQAVADQDDRVTRVAWRAGRRYRGGAAPPPEVLARSTADAKGVVQVDMDSADVQDLPGLDPASIETARQAERPDSIQASTEPVYSLAATPLSDGTTAVVLKASRPDDDRPLWETVLDEPVRRRPPPLRP